MLFHILTLFPEIVTAYTDLSILGRAKAEGVFQVDLVPLRDFGQGSYHKVDDTMYGGGVGMLMKADVLEAAFLSLPPSTREDGSGKISKYYFSPGGRKIDQATVEEIASKEEIVLLCGHYEGQDARFVKKYHFQPLSLGDFVLSGGELPALCLIDAVARLLQGTLKAEAHEEDSFSFAFGTQGHSRLLEERQYTRPPVWQGLAVPSILQSGHQAKIDTWRLQDRVRTTLAHRPDLLHFEALSLEDWCVIGDSFQSSEDDFPSGP